MRLGHINLRHRNLLNSNLRNRRTCDTKESVSPKTMKTAEFIDHIIENAPASAGDTAAFWRHMMADNSDAMLDKSVTAKKAALILYAFIKDVRGLDETDWGDAKLFRDIYDCRICANAIAQVCARGILKPERKDLFDGDRVMSDEALFDAALRAFNL